MDYSPVVLFTYNRPDTTQKVLDSLVRNEESVNTELYIFSDAAKNDSQISNVEAVREVIKSIDDSKFKCIHVTYQKDNKGLAQSIIDGVSEVFSRFSKAIILEDDCVVSPFFLKYMNGALSQYESNIYIGSVSGYTPELKYVPNSDVFAVMRSCSWGWGTWKSCWEKVDFSMSDYEKMRYNIRFIKNLNKCGNDRMYRLIRQKKYNIQSWSIRFGAYLASQGLLTVYPKYSYIENLGLEGGGVHGSLDAPKEMKTKVDLSIENPCFPIELKENIQITKQFSRIYAGSLLGQLKRTIYVWGGEKIIDAVREKK